MIERAVLVGLAVPWTVSASGWAYFIAVHEVVSVGVDWLRAGCAAGRRAVRSLPPVAVVVGEDVSPYLWWLCRDCNERFDTEIAMSKHITETGHTEVSLQRSPPASR